MLLSPSIYNKYKSSGGVDRCISPGLLNMMRGADVFMVNNECAISDRGAPLPEKEYTGRFFKGNAMLLLAVPATGNSFAGWSDGTKDNPRLVSPKDGAEYIALFK